MTIKSNIVRVTVKKKPRSIPVTLEGSQLCLENAERLFDDSQDVSLPTAFALLEISLEETSKALGLLMAFEMKQFNENPNTLQRFMELSGIAPEEYNKRIPMIRKEISDFFERNGENFFLNPFDESTWKKHEEKVHYISEFIGYMKEVTLPILRNSQDRLKSIESLYGKYFPKLDPMFISDIDNRIDEILSVNEQYLKDLINIKNQSLYVEHVGDFLMSPSSRNYVIEVLENLTWFLIVTLKNEIGILTMALA